MKESFSVLIPDGESAFALFAAHCLSKYPEVKVHVLSSDPWSPIRFSRYCESYTYKNTSGDSGSLLDAIIDVVNKRKIDVLLPTDTKGIYFVIDNMGVLLDKVDIVPLPERKFFELVNNKWLMAQFLEEKGILGPPSVLVDYDLDFEKKILELEFPVLLKPIISRGGDGIKRFDNSVTLIRFLNQQGVEKTQKQYIVQGFLSGKDVSLNILSHNGGMLALTIQKGIIPNTQEFGGPGAVEFIKNDRFSAVAQSLISALGWSGYACVDTLCDNNDNLYILDFNARFWGSLRGSWVAGISFPYLACQAGLRVPVSLPDYNPTRYFHPKTAIREAIYSTLRNKHETRPTLKETDLNFLWDDPLAELLRVYNQIFLDR